MVLLSSLDFSLPLTNPVIIFSIVLFIILFAPILLNKIKVPHIIGLIVAGIVVGPYGFNLLNRDSSIVLFGTVGLLYIMFLAGLEIDIAEFKKNAVKILFFGIVTFILPMIFGTLAGYYILGFGWLSSVLLASMFATHTLVSYPIASKYGITNNKSVLLSVGGTMIADILALLILVAVVGMTKEETNATFWIRLSISIIIFTCIVFFLFPVIIRWFFKNFEDSVSQYIFVLAMVFLASFLAEAAGMEAIIGALFSGFVLNKFIPHHSALMNRINFVGNALFIPFFLISVGMLVDVSVLVKGWGAIKVASVLIIIAIATKYIAAWITQKTFRLTSDEGKMIFGLSTARAAATLAIVLVGYNIITGETPNGEPIRLLNEDVLNGTILLILISCIVSSFVVEKAAGGIALAAENAEAELNDEDADEKVLVSLFNIEMVVPMIDLAILLKPKKSKFPLYALQVVDDAHTNESNSKTKKILDKAITHTAASDHKISPITRYDASIANGIIYTIKEQNITDTLIGLHQNADYQTFFGPTAEKILRRVWNTIYIYKSQQPFNTLQRIIASVPAHAEKEPGFIHWFEKIVAIAKRSGMTIHFYATHDTLDKIKCLHENSPVKVQMQLKEIRKWDNFLTIRKELKPNDLFVIISSRKGAVSYNDYFKKLPDYLTQHLAGYSFIILYPEQLETGINMENIEQMDNTLIETLSERIGAIGNAGKYLKKIFTERRRKDEDK